MTLVIGWNFAVGLILYWLISSVAVLLQQLLAEKVFKI
jgi:membrane protein insertase Oxa1/YidC/SpoIIIJ